MKLSAAWLIQHAGFEKGFGLEGDAREIAGGRASLSTKHTLAITNRGDATAEDIFAIARAVRAGVAEKFGVELVPEPVVVNGKIRTLQLLIPCDFRGQISILTSR